MKKNTTKGPRPIEDNEEITQATYKRLLKQLVTTPYWGVILLQSRAQDKLCMDSLVAIDPFKEPTMMARMQGMRSGLFSLENEVNLLVAETKDKGKKDSEDEIGLVK